MAGDGRAPATLSAQVELAMGSHLALWERLRGARVLVTGGTGFFGCWLLEAFASQNARLGLGARAVVLTRDPDGFRARAPALAAQRSITLYAGDVRSFAPPDGAFSHVIHAATEASARLNSDDPLAMIDTIVGGTRRVLEFASHAGTERLLIVSSGAVYGEQPDDVTHVDEQSRGGPDTMAARSAYAEAKRLAELLCSVYRARGGLGATVARGFAFVGPHLPLDTHFAIGNFLRDGLAGRAVRVDGDGTPVRSYMYGSDLATWLWTMLLDGVPARSYNVGSEQAISIAELAHVVAEHFGVPVEITGRAAAGQRVARYVPSTERARSELGLRCTVDLREAIARTALWHRARRSR